MNYYEELGISKNASEQDIKQAFRKLAKENHPDKTNGNKAKEEKFKRVNEAYQTLSDPKEKLKYDYSLNSSAKPFQYSQKNHNQQSFSDKEVEEIFQNSSFFAEFFKNKAKKAASPTVLNLHLSFFEAAFGCTKTVLIPDVLIPGKIKANIKVPPATVDNSELIITIKGVSFSVICKVEPDNEHTLDGLDIIKNIHVPLITTILGGVFHFYHRGKQLEVNIPEGSLADNKLRLKGMGVSKDGETGNLFLVIKTISPKNLTAKQKELLEEFNRIELSK